MMSLPMAEPKSNVKSSDSIYVERRAFPRRRPRCTATYRPADKVLAPDTRVKLTCISQGGACFVSRKELVLGQQIAVNLLSPAAAVPMLTVTALVCWICPDEAPGQYRIGCAWVERLNYAQLIPFW
jgi:PilZ domain-containing protein